MDQVEIHTNWTNSVHQVHRLALADLANAGKRALLKWAFAEPEKLKPGKTRQSLTRDAADQFARLALSLRQRGHDPH
jgi:hypothetical protein